MLLPSDSQTTYKLCCKCCDDDTTVITQLSETLPCKLKKTGIQQEITKNKAKTVDLMMKCRNILLVR